MKTIRSCVAVVLAACAVTSAYAGAADQVLDRIVENRRWSHYWFGKTGIDDAYAEGKKISALIFWNRSEDEPIRGLCSPELSRCVAYAGVYLDPHERQMRIAPSLLRSRRLHPG